MTRIFRDAPEKITAAASGHVILLKFCHNVAVERIKTRSQFLSNFNIFSVKLFLLQTIL